MSTSAEHPTHRRALAWAAGGAALVIAYGSLFPFDFDASRAALAWQSGALLGWTPPSRGDLVSNLILYLPLGALLVLALSPRGPRLGAFIATLGCGAALSLGIELTQNLLPDRTPSVFDLVLNVVSTGLGVGAALAWQRLRGTHERATGGLAAWLRSPPDPIALLVVGLWAAAHTAPFVPHGDVHSAWAALLPLREFAITPQGLLKYFAGLLLLASVLRGVLRRDRFWQGFLLVVLAGLACRLLFVRQNLGPNEPLALAIAWPIVAALRQQPNEHGAREVLAWSGIAWLASGVAPFDFGSAAAAFEWRPFAGFLTGDVETGYLAFLEKACFYTGWAWLAVYARLALPATLALGVVTLGAVEVAQCWLPGRVGEITDPLLFAVIAVGVATFGVRTPRADAPKDGTSPRRARRTARRSGSMSRAAASPSRLSAAASPLRR